MATGKSINARSGNSLQDLSKVNRAVASKSRGDIALFISPKYRVLSFRQEAEGRGQEEVFKLYFSQVKTAIYSPNPELNIKAE